MKKPAKGSLPKGGGSQNVGSRVGKWILTPEDDAKAMAGLRRQRADMQVAIKADDAKRAAKEAYKLGEMMATFRHIHSPFSVKARARAAALEDRRNKGAASNKQRSSDAKRDWRAKAKALCIARPSMTLTQRSGEVLRITAFKGKKNGSPYTQKYVIDAIRNVSASTPDSEL